MSVTISNWGFILKHKRYTRKSINQIILKILTLGELFSGLRNCRQIGKFMIKTPLGAEPGLETESGYETPSDLWSDRAFICFSFFIVKHTYPSPKREYI